MRIYFLFLLVILNGCSSIAKIENIPVNHLPKDEQRYSFDNHSMQNATDDIIFLLAFSGGGTRAATLSYGVLEELRDTRYQVDDKEVSLLDEVDRISSVSGGSFTSAYYGLFGEKIFTDFKDVFLYKDVQGDLSGLVFGFFNIINRIFSTTSRTELAINYYDKYIFHGKTFADLRDSGGPFILINAADLNSESQFTFVQTEFDFLCSDLSQFKVARAVTASSAVPVLFPPVLLKRNDTCDYKKPDWLVDSEAQVSKSSDQRLKKSVDALNYYLDKNNPPYVTLVDGGVTDNLGLRSILKNVQLKGGVEKIYKRLHTHQKKPKYMVMIVVNASTSSEKNIGKTVMLPSIPDTLSAVTDMQLHLYNTETNTLLKDKLKYWAKSISTAEQAIIPYFIDLDVTEIIDPDDRLFFNNIPTSFSLHKVQVDRLIGLSKKILRQNPEYQALLQELNAAHK
jgi:NTE family protein